MQTPFRTLTLAGAILALACLSAGTATAQPGAGGAAGTGDGSSGGGSGGGGGGAISVPADALDAANAAGDAALTIIASTASAAMGELLSMANQIDSLDVTAGESAVKAEAASLIANWGSLCRRTIDTIDALSVTADDWTEDNGGAQDVWAFIDGLKSDFEMAGALINFVTAHTALRYAEHELNRAIDVAESCMKRLRQVLSKVADLVGQVVPVCDDRDATDEQMMAAMSKSRGAAALALLVEAGRESVDDYFDNEPFAWAEDVSTRALELLSGNLGFAYLTALPSKLAPKVPAINQLQANVDTLAEDLVKAWEPLLEGTVIDEYSVLIDIGCDLEGGALVSCIRLLTTELESRID